jgi:hypothetical protein
MKLCVSQGTKRAVWNETRESMTGNRELVRFIKLFVQIQGKNR